MKPRWQQEAEAAADEERSSKSAPRQRRTEAPPSNRNGRANKAPASPVVATVPVVRTLAGVKARPVRWLWTYYLARGCVNILDGDPGLGKSTITTDLASRVTRGWAMPPGTGPWEGSEPEDVLILSAEDDAGTTIRPRLEAADADLERVHVFEAISYPAHQSGGIEIPESQRLPTLPQDLDLIEVAVRDRGVGLVIIDPLVAYFDPELDANKDQDVRLVLFRLSKLAASTGAAIVCVRHLNKYGANNAVYRGGGSIGIIGAARCGLLVGKHPEKPNAFVLAGVKSNLGPMPSSLEYCIETIGDVGRIGWGEKVEITANELVSAKVAGAQSDKQARKNKEDDGAILAALDRLARSKAMEALSGGPDAFGKTEIREAAGMSSERAMKALGRLIDQNILVEVPITYKTGRNAKVTQEKIGYRRAKRTDRTDRTDD